MRQRHGRPGRSARATILRTTRRRSVGRRPARRLLGQGLVITALLLSHAPRGALAGQAADLSLVRDDIAASLRGQADTGLRFSDTQTGNFDERLVALRGDPCARYDVDLTLDHDPVAPADWDAFLANRPKTPASSLNPKAVDSGDKRCGAWDVSFWADGRVKFGTIAGKPTNIGFDYVETGVSLGADYRFSTELTAGVGLGFDTDAAHADDTRTLAAAVNAVAYGSYHPSPATFVEMLAGAGRLALDTRRAVDAAGGHAAGRRGGTIGFGSVSAGVEERAGRVILAPYGKLAGDALRLDAFDEDQGEDPLGFTSQTAGRLTASLGLRAEFDGPRLSKKVKVSPWVKIEHGLDLTLLGDANLSRIPVGLEGAGLAGETSHGRHLTLCLGSSVDLGDDLTVNVDYSLPILADDPAQTIHLRSTLPF